MARPQKAFLDYFPFWCRGDERTDLLKAKKGMEGFGVYISLLIKLYGEKGYYLNWNETVCCIFSNNVGVDENEVKDIVSILINVGLFDKDIYENHGVLTSKEIQENYLFAISKRKNKSIDNRSNLVSVEETGVYGEETGVYVTESTQRKENKIKENKIKEKNIKEECRGGVSPPVQTKTPPPTPRGEMKNVFLTEEEYERLKEKYPDSDNLIERLSLYLASTGKSYASHYATLVRWATDEEKAATKQPPQDSGGFGDSYDIDEFFEAALRNSAKRILSD